jgi:hypothetical protein
VVIFWKKKPNQLLSIGKFQLNKPIAAMPDEYSIQHLKIVKDRKGSIGSEVLRRFSVFSIIPARKFTSNPTNT